MYHLEAGSRFTDHTRSGDRYHGSHKGFQLSRRNPRGTLDQVSKNAVGRRHDDQRRRFE